MQRVILAIKMESAVFVFDKPIIIKGEVRYCRPMREGGYKAGIKFIDVEAGALSRIREYVDNSAQ